MTAGRTAARIFLCHTFTYLSIDMNHGGQKESESLSRSRSRNSNHISALQRHRPSLTLNRGGFIKSALYDFGQNIFRHGSFVKRHAWLWNTCSLDYDLFGGSPGFSFLIASFGYIGMFQIEILFERNQFLLGEINIGEPSTQISTVYIRTYWSVKFDLLSRPQSFLQKRLYVPSSATVASATTIASATAIATVRDYGNR